MAKGRASKPKGSKKSKASSADPMFPSRSRNFRVGGDVRVKKDVSRFVRWPAYVRIQRQRKVLMTRLKVPPAINQFSSALDRAEAMPLFKLLKKYAPETSAEKKQRIVAQAEAKAAGGDGTAAKPFVTKFGLNHVTYLVEQKKATLVVIASDVDPIELVVWLPALCRHYDVPYVIVNNKGRLGTVVNQKKAAVVAITEVKQEDAAALAKLQELARARFNDNTTLQRKWGGGIMGLKTQARVASREAAIRAELEKKAQY